VFPSQRPSEAVATFWVALTSGMLLRDFGLPEDAMESGKKRRSL